MVCMPGVVIYLISASGEENGDNGGVVEGAAKPNRNNIRGQGRPFVSIRPSPWPLMCAGGTFGIAVGIVSWMYLLGAELVFLGALVLLLGVAQWWRDILREGDIGYHTSYMIKGFRDGVALFILSEAMFFFSLFWAFFHSALAPAIQVGCHWPPKGIHTLNPWSIPLANTAVLLTSGSALTYAKYSLRSGDFWSTVEGMVLAILFGLLFTGLQMYEYYWASFTIADGIYGSCFYILTGFHGVHVIAGTIFIIITFARLVAGHFRPNRHFGFEACTWYWHFVDGVWLLVYGWVYVWGR